MSEHWFRRRERGRGAYPTSWQGWIAVAIYVCALLAATLWLIILPVSTRTGPNLAEVLIWIALAALMTGLLVWQVFARSEGRPPADRTGR